MAFTVQDYNDLVRLLAAHPEWRPELRRLVLSDELLALPEIVRELAEAQRRSEERLEALTEEVRALTQEVRALTDPLGSLVNWQRGEAGRREGERYERLIVKRAPALFNGGQGGPTDQPFVQQRLMERLRSLPALDSLADDENPFLADLLWWKGERWLVVEASLQVNGEDVQRAAQRAAALRKARLEAMGVVVGQAWTGVEARQQAEARGVQWKVGDDLSEGLLEFRRLAV